MTAEEFEKQYAERSGITVERLRELGRIVRPCHCGQEGCEGWQSTTLERIYDPPKFWLHETGGLLAVAIKRYLVDEHMYPSDILLMRTYLRQWIDSPVWDQNPTLDDEGRKILSELRRDVRAIQTRDDIEGWLERAEDFGIDPL